MPAIYREIKLVTATIASGQATSSGIQLGGFAVLGLAVPVITSAYLAFLHEYTGGSYTPVYDKAGAIVSAATPAGTGGVALSSDALTPLAGYPGEIRISAAANQGANRNFVWYLKG